MRPAELGWWALYGGWAKNGCAGLSLARHRTAFRKGAGKCVEPCQSQRTYEQYRFILTLQLVHCCSFGHLPKGKCEQFANFGELAF